MGLWALLLTAVYTVLNATVSHYQHFTLEVAQAVSGDLGGDSRRQVRALQRSITPTIMGSVGWLSYVLLATAFVFAFRTWGWLGAGPLLVWGYIGTAFLGRVWPLPSRAVCARLAAAEVEREEQLPNLEPEERSLVRSLITKRLADQR